MNAYALFIPPPLDPCFTKTPISKVRHHNIIYYYCTGINPYSLDGSNVGVFMSTGYNELQGNTVGANTVENALTLAGSSKNMVSNRISFTLNLRGESIIYKISVHEG